MKEQVLGFNISLLVHGIILAVCFALSQGKMFENNPIVIDLSILSSNISSGSASGNRSGHQKPPSTIRNENRNVFEPSVSAQNKVLKSTPASPKKSLHNPMPQRQPALKDVKFVSMDKTQAKVPKMVPSKTMKEVIQVSPKPEITAPRENDMSVIDPGTYDTVSNTLIKKSTPGVRTDLSEGGKDGGNTGDLGQDYVNMHFNYLRERIRKNLCYPKIARKMGWDGKVLVAFTILKNGHVDNLEIRKSCGINLLDHSAMETVRMACPFPKPPAVSKIVIPIVYNLN